MDLEYWKQRAMEAEQALKDGAGTAVDATKRAVDYGKAAVGIDNDEPLGPQITEPVGKAAGDLKSLFLDKLVPGGDPALQRPQPGQSAEPPAPSLSRPQPGQRAEPPGNMERALKAAEEAFNSVMKGGGNAADAAQGMGRDLWNQINPPTLERPQPGQSPTYPGPDRSGPPFLQRPQPGQSPDYMPPPVPPDLDRPPMYQDNPPFFEDYRRNRRWET
jgi:hypothetical protein